MYGVECGMKVGGVVPKMWVLIYLLAVNSTFHLFGFL